jgi:N-sulfoglucosamine sulfohydrolase
VYRAEEVQVPGYLSDDPVMRKELAHYYSSVRRADDAVGQVLEALERSGESENTLVILLADHGMPFPFAKTQLYHHSTRTPLVVRWPQVINAGSIDTKHMVSAVDILPTILDGIGVDIPQGVEGRSFFTLLKGNTQEDREWVIKEYNENAAGDRTPMRAVESHRFLYIFNPWSNGIRVMRSATKNTQSHKRMLELAKDDATIARRLAMLDHRVLEEFYDIQVDPDCLVNLIGDPAYQSEIANYRAILEEWMRDTADPMFSTFVNRNDSQVLEDYMLEQNQIVLKRRAWIKAIRQSQRKKNGA